MTLTGARKSPITTCTTWTLTLTGLRKMIFTNGPRGYSRRADHMRPMIIDLSKSARKRAAHLIESALSWMGWNQANPLHPKGPDGRWVEGHPFTHIMGDAPDHIHHMHDEDLAKIDRHVDSLRDAITREKGRRGIERHAKEISAARTYGTKPKEPAGEDRPFSRLPEAERRQHALNRGRTIEEDMAASREDRINSLTAQMREAEADMAAAPVGSPARARALKKLKDLKDERGRLGAAVMSGKPLRATGKPKVDMESIRGEWEAAIERPMPSDRESFKAKLNGLTLKQLEELNGGEKLSGSNKAEKIGRLIEHRLGFRLNSEAIRHGLGNTSSHWKNNPERSDRFKKIDEELQAADLAGDRKAYERIHRERVAFSEGHEGIEHVSQARARTAEEKRLADEDRRLRFGETPRPDDKPRAVPPSANDIQAGHKARLEREKQIQALTDKINEEEDPSVRQRLRAERATLATWKPEGSRQRPKEPFQYEGENPERARERHGAAFEAMRPAMEHNQARAEETAGKVRDFLRERRGSRDVTDEQILEIIRGAKLNPQQLKLTADELGVSFSPNNQFDRAITTKVARERYMATAVASAHRRNPSGQHHIR